MRKCKYCDTELPKEKKQNIFCNSSCAASFNNKGIRRNKSLGDRKKIKCLECGTLTVNAKFCCFDCSNIFRRKERKKKIFAENKIFDNRDKKYLIEERGNVCEMCGTSEWLENPILLILDHIDGNSDNNSLDNVRLICSNCDATLPTYKAKNKDKGRDTLRRKYRQKRYKLGSCN